MQRSANFSNRKVKGCIVKRVVCGDRFRATVRLFGDAMFALLAILALDEPTRLAD
jgi:hypothetical protein